MLTFNGTEPTSIIFNDVQLSEVICDGVLVWTAFNHAEVLKDFEYTINGDGTYTITGWKGTYQGEPSTLCIIPDDERIIV